MDATVVRDTQRLCVGNFISPCHRRPLEAKLEPLLAEARRGIEETKRVSNALWAQRVQIMGGFLAIVAYV